MNRFFKKLKLFPRHLAVALIDVYQAILSPDHSWVAARFPYGYCRHYPSCSEYGRQSLLKHGLLKGLFFSGRRILR